MDVLYVFLSLLTLVTIGKLLYDYYAYRKTSQDRQQTAIIFNYSLVKHNVKALVYRKFSRLFFTRENRQYHFSSLVFIQYLFYTWCKQLIAFIFALYFAAYLLFVAPSPCICVRVYLLSHLFLVINQNCKRTHEIKQFSHSQARIPRLGPNHYNIGIYISRLFFKAFFSSRRTSWMPLTLRRELCLVC